MPALQPPFVLFRNDLTGREMLFERPLDIIVATTAGEYLEALDAAEASRRAGRWLAGYFAYEAGYLLEPSLAGLLPGKRRGPLAVLGIFDGPAETTRAEAGRAPVRWNSATCACSLRRPYIKESGVGGQPGTYTSTGTTRSTPFTTW